MCYSVCICCFLVNFLFSHTNSSAIPLPYNSIHIVFPFLSLQDQTFLWKTFAEHSIHFTSLHFTSFLDSLFSSAFSLIDLLLLFCSSSSFALNYCPFSFSLENGLIVIPSRLSKWEGKSTIDNDWLADFLVFPLSCSPITLFFLTSLHWFLTFSPPSLFNYPSPPPLPPFNSYSMFIQKSPTFNGFLLIFNSNPWWLSAVTFLYFSTSFLTLLLYFSLAWLTLLFLLLLFLLHSYFLIFLMTYFRNILHVTSLSLPLFSFPPRLSHFPFLL